MFFILNKLPLHLDTKYGKLTTKKKGKPFPWINNKLMHYEEENSVLLFINKF